LYALVLPTAWMVDSSKADRGVAARYRNTCSPPHLIKHIYEVDISIQPAHIISFFDLSSLTLSQYEPIQRQMVR
jgi:hypothetical protein